MSNLELSPFQKEKLRYYFKFLGPNEQNVIDRHCVDRLMEKVYIHNKWAVNSPKALKCLEVHTAFLEALLANAEREVENEKTAMLEDWYKFWSKVLSGSKGMNNLPVWLRLMPKVLFNIIDTNADNVIDTEELTSFYTEMVGVSTSESELEKGSKQAYASMTDSGRYALNMDSYEQIFANFLFGRTPEGPGKYIFGCFKHDLAPYQLIQPSAHDPEDKAVGIHVRKDKRPRKFDVVFT